MFIHGGTSGTIGSGLKVQRLTAGNLMANMGKVKVNQLKDRLALGGFTMARAMSRPDLTPFVLPFFTSHHEIDQGVA